ncbi:MAG TPA: acyl-CoA thioester hydrolase/BAAT C-terminal domain-containing protein [Gemmataceae bacterium]|nr:acyl-CoA thioester hydrolase/BAAT C-terminal domain-containing protein [Gemmataceae bacterium]
MLFWLGVALLCSMSVLLFLTLVLLHVYIRVRYLHFLIRIFQEKPLFVIPRGQALPEAEQVRFPTSDGLTLSGCYLRAASPRRGVILFGLEFGSNCWACRSYCEHLVEKGFDVFAFESRNQGTSDAMRGYEPLQWVTTYEVSDVEAALAYLKGRPDADPRGIGFFGISKGAGAGLFVAARDPYIRCCVTDGAFATYTTLVPYMKQWFRIYNDHYTIQGLIPLWFYGLIGLAGIRRIERERRCRFPHLERYLPRLAPRPLLMIHGQADTYIKAEMTSRLFEFVREPKELWLVENAKHNQALQVAGEEYRQRVLRFFEMHLAEKKITMRRDAERPDARSHAERGNQEGRRTVKVSRQR